MSPFALSAALALICVPSVQGDGNLRGLQSFTWDGTLKTTHYWDCNGQDCDSKTVPAIEETPGNWVWQSQLFSASPLYAPLDPNDYGGPSVYGEKFWATGAANDDLAELLGPDVACGTSDLSPGGCGKCLLVQNANAVNSDWKVMVMKKNRCPPYSPGCEAGNLHLDIAVPGYDDTRFSTGNVCAGNPAGQHRDNVFGMTWDTSSSCSRWYEGNDNTQDGCDCTSVTTAHGLQKGCRLFSDWGWKASATIQLSYKVVACPSAFISVIEGAFSPAGPSTGISTTTLSTTTATASCDYVAYANTAVHYDGTGKEKLRHASYGSTDEYIAACKAACNADSSCGGFVDDPTDSRGRMCKPKKASVGYGKAGKTFYAKGAGC